MTCKVELVNAPAPHGGTPPAPSVGPMRQAIAAQWQLIWKAQAEGGVWEYPLDVANATMANFRATQAGYTPPQLADLSATEHFHAAQSRHFAAHLDGLNASRVRIQWALESTYTAVLKVSEHLVRSLTIANGAVVLGTLAFIGNVRSPELQNSLLPVLGLCGSGFLLALGGGHASVLTSRRTIALLGDLTAPRISEAVRTAMAGKLKIQARRTLRVVQPFYYLSALCLVAALCLGVVALRVSPESSPPSPASDVLVE